MCIMSKKIRKLHKQLAHPSAKAFKELLRTAGIHDKSILKLIDSISDNCNTCKQLKRPANRPAVGLPFATEFNELVALDLKALEPGVIQCWFYYI